MNLLKEGKTNWKYILIVVILAVIVGGAILGYCWWTKQEIPLLEIKKPEEVEEEIVDWRIYRNERYGFEFTFPDRWKDYKVSEEDTAIAFKLKHTRDDEYHTVFRIKIYPKEKWDQLQSKEEPSVEKYIDEKQGYVFAYSVGHDDEGYVGFPEVVPGEIYQGPFYDVENKIIPTFKFLAEDETTNWKTYRNEEHGFEFKYSERWGDISDSPAAFVYRSDSTIIFKPPEFEEQYLATGYPFLEMRVRENPQRLDLENFYFPLFKEYKTKEKFKENLRIQQVQDVIYYQIPTPWGELLTIFSLDSTFLEFSHRTYIAEQERVFNQMLSTFRFIEVDETANWKTYRNEEYGFKIKYPPDWGYEDDTQNDCFPQHPCISSIDFRSHIATGWVAVMIFDNPDALSVKDWLYKFKELKELEKLEQFEEFSLKEIEIGGEKGLRLTYLPPHPGQVTWQDDIYISKKNFIYDISLPGIYNPPEIQEAINQMLSTFRFIW